jgi:hypothetical protein
MGDTRLMEMVFFREVFEKSLLISSFFYLFLKKVSKLVKDLKWV